MKQVVQAVSGGPVRVMEVPRPVIGPTEVLVRSAVTTISPGTERAVTALARSSLLDKARARPDLVRQVLDKARSDGLRATASTVRTRLDQDMPLGYSGCGLVIQVGEAVAGVSPGQLVATGGAGKACHAEYQAVPGLLCVPVPDGVSAQEAALATIASIALHGLRLADMSAGHKVVVVGLGLVGQLALRLARASGADVHGIDIDPAAVELARSCGVQASVEEGEQTTRAVRFWTRERGADAVIVAAAGSSSKVMRRVPDLCRDHAPVVVVGDVGLDLDRRPYYERELSVRFARSYGPGRYERTYDDWAIDYPPGLVRFTEGRNIETVLDLLARGQLEVGDLVTHTFDMSEAPAAYELIESRGEHVVGVQLAYPARGSEERPERPIPVSRPSRSTSPGLGVIGAGAFVTSVLLPSMQRAGFDKMVSVTSASGLSARHLADRAGFARAVSGPDAVIEDPDVDVVVVATPHDLHAELTARALRAGKHVFCEKPLALSLDELAIVEAAADSGGGVLFVGFNRRWSGPVREVRDWFGPTGSPLVITYRVNAGSLPGTHWYNDRRQGGRLLGEVCHFIDTCSAIVGEVAVDVGAVAGARPGAESALADDLGLLLRYQNGSVAAITYAAGGPASVAKERIEVLGRGRAATIDDFREVTLDGARTTYRPPDKGHVAEAIEMLARINGRSAPTAEAIASTRTALDALSALGSGAADPDHC